MNKEYPLVSVIMPSYNHEKYIEEAIRSVWDQTYSNVELIVLDDGSKDNSPEIIKELEKISPIPMKVVLKNNEGVCKTLNQGVDLSKGKYIGILASDDIYFPEKTTIQVNAFNDLGDSYAVVYSDGLHMNEKGEALPRKLSDRVKVDNKNEDDFTKIIKHQFIISPQSALFRKDYVENVGKFDINLSFEDFDLYLKLAKKYKFYFANEVVVYYRFMDSGLREKVKLEEVMEIIFKHIDFLDERKHTEILRNRYMKFAEHNLYIRCDIQKGLGYYIKLVKLKTFEPYYYKYMFRFLFRCIIIKVFGGNIVAFKRKIWK